MERCRDDYPVTSRAPTHAFTPLTESGAADISAAHFELMLSGPDELVLLTSGQALKTPSGSFGWIKTGLQKTYLTKWKGLDLNKVCIVTLMFEGEVQLH